MQAAFSPQAILGEYYESPAHMRGFRLFKGTQKFDPCLHTQQLLPIFMEVIIEIFSIR